MIKKLAIASTALIMASTAAQADSTVVFTGANFTENSDYSYLGLVTALNGDLGTDGLLVRVSGAMGNYDYGRAPLTDIDADAVSGDIMIGYQKFTGNEHAWGVARYSIYAGYEHQEHDLSGVDALNPVQGSEGGLKALFEADWTLNDVSNITLSTSYSSAFETYWVRSSYGYDLGSVTVGPEVILLGSESFNQKRFGAFVNEINLIDNVNLGLSGGLLDGSGNRTEDGAYGQIDLSFSF